MKKPNRITYLNNFNEKFFAKRSQSHILKKTAPMYQEARGMNPGRLKTQFSAGLVFWAILGILASDHVLGEPPRAEIVKPAAGGQLGSDCRHCPEMNPNR